jgi:hypothetical protein
LLNSVGGVRLFCLKYARARLVARGFGLEPLY